MSDKNTPAAGEAKATPAAPAPKAKTLMGNVTNKNLFLWKPGPVYLHNNKAIDLRTINDQVALALANDPACAFIQFADPAKRPQHQRNAFPEGWVNP